MSDKNIDEGQEWFERRIGNDLRRFDAAHEPPPLHVDQLEVRVGVHKRHARKRLWRELMLFWAVAAVVLAGMLWVLERNWMWLVVIQAVSAAGAFVYLGLHFRRKVSGQWRNG